MNGPTPLGCLCWISPSTRSRSWRPMASLESVWRLGVLLWIEGSRLSIDGLEPEGGSAVGAATLGGDPEGWWVECRHDLSQ